MHIQEKMLESDAVAERPWAQEELESLKCKINEFLWCNLPGGVSIKTAESFSCAIFDVFIKLQDNPDWPKK